MKPILALARTLVRGADFLSAKDLLQRASMISIAFLAARLAGLREFTERLEWNRRFNSSGLATIRLSGRHLHRTLSRGRVTCSHSTPCRRDHHGFDGPCLGNKRVLPELRLSMPARRGLPRARRWRELR